MKEDEREVLAHMIQNIDEQEIFLEFVAKAETIKETWQITQIFESKKKEFMESLQEYDESIKQKESELKLITAEITDANNLLKEANNELESLKLQLEEMRSKAQFYKNKILQGKHFESMDLQGYNFMLNADNNERDSLNITDVIKEFKPLSTVSVHVKNGNIAMARVAQVVYPKELYEIYGRAGNKLLKMKKKIDDLELENKKLNVELRDLSKEDDFKDTMRNQQEALDYNEIEITTHLKPASQKNNEYADIDSLSLTQRIERIDKKKEKVEEMFNQLNSILREDTDLSIKSNMEELLKFRNSK